MRLHKVARSGMRTALLTSALSVLAGEQASAQTDPVGRISKGQVQAALGVNNAELQEQADSLSMLGPCAEAPLVDGEQSRLAACEHRDEQVLVTELRARYAHHLGQLVIDKSRPGSR